jgi:hypothetical protein
MAEVPASLRGSRLAELYARTKGRAWEPRDPCSPGVQWLIAEGYVRKVDGRCGFELMKHAYPVLTHDHHI